MPPYSMAANYRGNSGAYTIANSHKMKLGANDFVITPNGCWHEFGEAPHETLAAGRARRR